MSVIKIIELDFSEFGINIYDNISVSNSTSDNDSNDSKTEQDPSQKETVHSGNNGYMFYQQNCRALFFVFCFY